MSSKKIISALKGGYYYITGFPFTDDFILHEYKGKRTMEHELCVLEQYATLGTDDHPQPGITSKVCDCIRKIKSIEEAYPHIFPIKFKGTILAIERHIINEMIEGINNFIRLAGYKLLEATTNEDKDYTKNRIADHKKRLFNLEIRLNKPQYNDENSQYQALAVII